MNEPLAFTYFLYMKLNMSNHWGAVIFGFYPVICYDMGQNDTIVNTNNVLILVTFNRH